MAVWGRRRSIVDREEASCSDRQSGSFRVPSRAARGRVEDLLLRQRRRARRANSATRQVEGGTGRGKLQGICLSGEKWRRPFLVIRALPAVDRLITSGSGESFLRSRRRWDARSRVGAATAIECGKVVSILSR